MTDVQLSKKLSYVLRHKAVNMGFNIDEAGYILLDEILNHIQFKNCTFNQIKNIVDNCDKQRFSLIKRNDKYYIRANQGHTIRTISDDNLLTKITNPRQIPICIHGTYNKYLPSILRNGLSRMSRNHIHFACGETYDKNVISGMRTSCEIKIYINTERAMNDNISFYKSENNVILSVGINGVIPPKYFEKIIKK